MATAYIYTGSSGVNIGRFTALAQGATVYLEDSEVGDSRFMKKPVAATDSRVADNGADVQTKTGAYTVVGTDRLIKCNLSAGAEITLPASPAAGHIVEVVDIAGNAASNNITIGRNGKTVDGGTSNPVINTNGGSKRLYYNGAGWISW